MADTSLLVADGHHPKLPKYMVAAISSWMGSIALGTVIGYTANTIPSLQGPGSHVPITTEEVSWLGSLMALGAVFGSICAGQSIEYIGRKGTLMFTSLPFLLGWLLMAYAGRLESPVILLIGRFLTGFCCGLVSLSAPVYIAETAPPSKRGFLGAGFQLSVTVGVVIAFVLGKYLTWAWVAVTCCLFPLLLLFGMCLMPETPYWLIKRGRISEATDAHLFLHGLDAVHNINSESSTTSVSLDGQSEEVFSLSLELRKRHVVMPIVLTLCLMLFQQLSGVNAMIFYTTSIFQTSGSSSLDPSDATIIVGTVQVVATFLACLLIDRTGRRPLMIVSSLGCGLSILLLSVFHFVGDKQGDQFLTSYAWIPIVSLISFMIAFSFGLGPVPWLLMGELLPSHVKSVGSGLCSSFNWLCAFLITKLFHSLIEGLHESGTYLMLSMMCFKCCAFVVFLLPETNGKSLTEIEGLFRRPTIN